MNAEEEWVAVRVAAKRSREAEAMERAMTEDQLLADAKANLLVLRTLHNVPITDAQIEGRARNFVAGILGSYEVRLLP